MTVIINKNYKTIDTLIDFLKDKNISAVLITLINEGPSLKYRLSKKELIEFYTQVLPIMIQKSDRNKIKFEIQPEFVKLIPLSPIIKVKYLSKYINQFYDEINFYSEQKYGAYFYNKYHCLTLNRAIIREDGNVFPCCPLMSKSHMCMGNIYKDSFYDIWNSKKYKQFRENKNIPKCNTCLECAEYFQENYFLNQGLIKTKISF